jgi:hypothetical protein
MGKPKALKERELPRRTKTSNEKKHINFDESDDPNAVIGDIIIHAVKAKKGNSHSDSAIVEDDGDGDLPEVISSHSIEVQKLRELHEKMNTLVPKKKRNKRHRIKDDTAPPIDRDKALDDSILQSLEDDSEVDEDQDHEDTVESTSTVTRKLKIPKIDATKRYKKM